VKRLAKLKSLSLEDWRLLLTAQWMLWVVALRLRHRGLNQTLQGLRAAATDTANAAGGGRLGEARMLARIVAIASRRGPGPDNCLIRSLVLIWFLEHRGISNELRFGVPRAAGSSEGQDEFSAHAWVEHAGEPVNDGPDTIDRFAVLGPGSP
jgi:hypothetical protein